MAKSEKQIRTLCIEIDKEKTPVQVDEQALKEFLRKMASQIYDETVAMRGCRTIKPETYNMQIGMDEV